MLDYLKHKLKPYLDLITTLVCDGILVVVAMTVYHWVTVYADFLRVSENDKHSVDPIIWMVHNLLNGLLAIYIINDLCRAIIKTISELKKEWKKNNKRTRKNNND